MRNNKNPVVFLDSVTHFGGSIKSTVILLNELKNKCEIMVLDIGGCCSEYIEALEYYGIPYQILLPNAKRQIIGGRLLIVRLVKMLQAYREISQIIRLLRKKIVELNPQVVWLNSEKFMFCLGRAVGNKFSTLMFIRGKHSPLKWYCLRDWKRLKLIVGNNSESLNLFRQLNWAKNKLAIVYNGIDINEINNTAELKKGLPDLNRDFKIILPATLIPLKNHTMAIKAFSGFAAIYPDSVLWICGDTPNNLPMDYENSLHKLCTELNLAEKVHFLGWRSDVPAVITKADILILTSTTEGFPRTILEAMALGTPVISTSVGGVPEIIKNGKDGFLVPLNAIEKLTKTLTKLTDVNIRKQLAQNALETVKQRFTVKQQVKKFLNCISEI